MKVAVIIPTLNEADSIRRLLDALVTQTRVPDEIVVGDGGSTDGTAQIVSDYGPPVRLVSGGGGISENRNAAIDAATSEIIACTDAGCLPDPEWLERITAPFDDGAKWVAGMSRPADDRPLQAAIGLAMMPVPDEIDVDFFVPGGASQAFLKAAWSEVGGFPEGMAAGEDTVYGERMRARGIRPVVVPDAQVVWQAPDSPLEMVRKAFRWGRADGLAATEVDGYLRLVGVWLMPALVGAWLTLRRRMTGPVILGAMVGASAFKTRPKRKHLATATGRGALPVLHSVRIASQSAGWLMGFNESSERDPWPSIGHKLAARLLALAKRIIRPIIPDTVMLRLRKAPATSGRQNIDILVSDGASAERWLDATPDTYRAGELPDQGVETGELVFVPEDATAEVHAMLARAFHADDIEAAVVAITEPPRIDLGKINEPSIDPLGLAVKATHVPTTMPPDPSTALHVVREAGLHLSVVPVSGGEPLDSRRPIGDPGAVLLCGTIPMHDVGGGSRGAQMAHELVAAGYHVTYLNLFDSDEAVDLGLRYAHPNLDQIAVENFDFDRYLDRLATDRRFAILELPHPRYFSMLNRARAAGFAIAYDLMDDWSDQSLGGWGYTVHDEMETIRMSQALVASAPSLVSRLERMSDRPVVLVPNAVNTRLFHPGEHPVPEDMPPGDGPVLEYHGSLYGEWFDWSALERTALDHPSARLVVIGDDRRRRPMPDNVHFLGLKPQHTLPQYLAHTDVAMIPFEVSQTTHAVSPLKVFEYLAMAVPVASVPLAPVVDLAGVYTDDDLSKAVDLALDAPDPDPESVAREHSWRARMRALFSALDAEYLEDDQAKPIHISQHPVKHWSADERRL